MESYESKRHKDFEAIRERHIQAEHHSGGYPGNAARAPGMSVLKGAATNAIMPGSVAAMLVCSAIAVLGRSDSGSAIAPINASSHVIWGEQAGQVEKATLKQTLPGLAINVGASFWWAFVCEALFGRKMDNSGPGTALAAGVATAGMAYVLDYRIIPRRLSPGWEQRLSGRSLFASLGIMGLGLGIGALLARQR